MGSTVDTARQYEPGNVERRARQTRIMVDATRHFTDNPRPSLRDVEAYKELFYQFIGGLLPADRRLISTLLARSVFTPRAVAIYLATDTLDIAIPFLLFSPVLGEHDLNAISAKKGERYGEVIAKRQVSVTIGSALTEMEDQEEGREDVQAETSRQEAQAPATAEKAELNATIEIDEEAFRETQSKFPTMPEAMTLPTGGKEAIADGEALLALASVGGRLGRIQPRTADIAENKMEMAGVTGKRHYDLLPRREVGELLELARKQDLDGLATVLAGYSGLEAGSIRSLMDQRTGDEFIYLIKAIGIEAPRDIQLLLMAVPRYGRSSNAYLDSKKLLGDLDTGICRMIFNQIGAAFDLPKLDSVPIAPVRPVDAFTDAARRRRSEFSPEQVSQPAANPAVAPAPAAIPQAMQDRPARRGSSHRDFRHMIASEPLVNFG